ncbi:hypothetical protein GCM10028862_18520 [Luteimonas pelagia]
MALERYRDKRRFEGTPEPGPASRRRRGKGDPIFVVQLHHARARHYDFRLEVDGVLRSWAVPKGPSLRPSDKRLAVEVEDHPIDYADFAGEIPEGHYGAGHVALFDRGTWSTDGDAGEAIAAGKLDFVLDGERLRGRWKLVRTRPRGGKPQWLLMKADDAHAADLEADDMLDAAPAAPARRAASPGKPTKRAGGSRRTGRGRGATWARKASAVDGARDLVDPDADIPPQLATARKVPPAGAGWLHEVKWDGYRLLARLRDGRARLRSRNGLDWTGDFPGIVEALEALSIGDADFDGELIALDDGGRSDFGKLQSAIKRRRTGDLRYILFDLPTLAGVDLRGAALVDRKALLRALLEGNDDLRLVYSSHGLGNGAEAFAASEAAGLEGIVSKRVGATYASRRTDDWLKLRHHRGEDYVVVGYTAPQGSRTGLGALLLACREDDGRLRYVGRVGSGFDEATLKDLSRRLRKLETGEGAVELPAHTPLRERDVTWVHPRLVVEVAFRGWGREGLLRQASFLRVRDDKAPVQAPSRATTRGRAAAAGDDAPPKRRRSGSSSRPRAAAARARPATRSEAPARISSPDRVVYAGPGITKGEVADYYRAVADRILPGIAARPLSLLRCPDGVGGECFFQKHFAESLGDHVDAVALEEKAGGRARYIAVHDVEGVIDLVQMNALEFHPWGARVEDLEHPDVLVFDLDPGPGVDWPAMIDAAREVRDRLASVQLASFARLSGGKGVHVVLPIASVHGWAQAKGFCEAFAKAMAQVAPKRFTATASKAQRRNRIFIDWLRNGRGATSIASWSLRARPGAGVAMPVRWEELGRTRGGDHYDLAAARNRAARLKSDPWEGWEDASDQRLPEG